MKRFLGYLYDCRYMWIWFILSGGAFVLCFALYEVELKAAVYPVLLSAVFGILFFVLGYLRREKKYKRLFQISETGGIVSESLPKPDCMTEREYQKILLRSEEEYRKQREEWQAARKDMNDYYATWVHQIKAPIAVMRVLLQQEDTPINRELTGELFRVEQYVEMALCYVRLGEGASDLVIKEYPLADMIRKAIRKYAGQLIRRKLRVIYEGTDICVLTDEKWLVFIIEQLLSNAVKYTVSGNVTITVDREKKQLSISDTGIGISPEDLPRIFEKGYTGYNGRLDKKSTGIGLYLCRTAADKLGHKLTAQSTVGKGSSFTIDLSSYPLEVE